MNKYTIKEQYNENGKWMLNLRRRCTLNNDQTGNIEPQVMHYLQNQVRLTNQ